MGVIGKTTTFVFFCGFFMFFGNISPISLIYYQYYVIDANKKIRMIPAPVLLITAACLLYSGQASQVRAWQSRLRQGLYIILC